MLHFEELVKITSGEILCQSFEGTINQLLTDSRKAHRYDESLFFAIVGERHDGHDYIKMLYEKGVRQFVLEREVSIPDFNGNILLVNNTLEALQQIAEHHRKQYDFPVVGITGSNGKTIVKEWLYSMMAPLLNVVRSPRSYNSQLGVPLSVWEMNEKHDLALFEAGISQPGEMEKLEKVIQPSIGILTNLRTAHDEGFESRGQKLQEKMKLFKNCDKIIYCRDQGLKSMELDKFGFSWGSDAECDLQVSSIVSRESKSLIDAQYKQQKLRLFVPFADQASLENAMHCIAFMVYSGYDESVIQAGLNRLQKVNMRLELKKGINQSYIVDDSYNNDLAGLQIAVDFLNAQKQAEHKTIILSDILQSGLMSFELYKKAADIVNNAQVNQLIGIGQSLVKHKELFDCDTTFFTSTEEFIEQYDFSQLSKELILVKGARPFQFEKIVKRLEEQIHGTLLEINLDALTANLNFYRSKLNKDTQLMVMVKAFAYGSGSQEIANLLQYHQVDYLGVAYADEGVALREAGIRLPIMVMNPSVDSFEKLMLYQLEPELYNFRVLHQFIAFAEDREAYIHIKLDTGMRRLGFTLQEIDELNEILSSHPNLHVQSIFSHLAGADEATHNSYSEKQASLFDEMSHKVAQKLPNQPLRHLVNSPGILRFPQYHFDMVRLGIGLYGFEANQMEQQLLTPISQLKTVISQIKNVKRGETIGYGRKGKAEKDLRIATIAIGYADGFSRAFSNGVGKVLINGKRAPVIGNVCMDMTMVDITDIQANEGDEVEIFGPNISITELANDIGTIPYEILTNVSQRVKRVYYTE